MKYKLNQYPNEEHIYVVTTDNQYDLAMLFMRVQEYYESSFKQIKGKEFTIFKFMELYSKKFGDGAFTYAKDWEGFNVPGKVLDTLYGPGYKYNIQDPSEYDGHMEEILNKIKSKEFYLIGAVNKDASTIEHELCHARFALDKNYKKKVREILKQLPDNIKKKIKDHLLSIGYCKGMLEDELQAYVSSDYYYLIENIKFSKGDKKMLWKIHCSF
jgi:hypothetical protein